MDGFGGQFASGLAQGVGQRLEERDKLAQQQQLQFQLLDKQLVHQKDLSAINNEAAKVLEGLRLANAKDLQASKLEGDIAIETKRGETEIEKVKQQAAGSALNTLLSGFMGLADTGVKEAGADKRLDKNLASQEARQREQLSSMEKLEEAKLALSERARLDRRWADAKRLALQSDAATDAKEKAALDRDFQLLLTTITQDYAKEAAAEAEAREVRTDTRREGISDRARDSEEKKAKSLAAQAAELTEKSRAKDREHETKITTARIKGDLNRSLSVIKAEAAAKKEHQKIQLAHEAQAQATDNAHRSSEAALNRLASTSDLQLSLDATRINQDVQLGVTKSLKELEIRAASTEKGKDRALTETLAKAEQAAASQRLTDEYNFRMKQQAAATGDQKTLALYQHELNVKSEQLDHGFRMLEKRADFENATAATQAQMRLEYAMDISRASRMGAQAIMGKYADAMSAAIFQGDTEAAAAFLELSSNDEMAEALFNISGNPEQVKSFLADLNGAAYSLKEEGWTDRVKTGFSSMYTRWTGKKLGAPPEPPAAMPKDGKGKPDLASLIRGAAESSSVPTGDMTSDDLKTDEGVRSAITNVLGPEPKRSMVANLNRDSGRFDLNESGRELLQVMNSRSREKRVGWNPSTGKFFQVPYRSEIEEMVGADGDGGVAEVAFNKVIKKMDDPEGLEDLFDNVNEIRRVMKLKSIPSKVMDKIGEDRELTRKFMVEAMFYSRMDVGPAKRLRRQTKLDSDSFWDSTWHTLRSKGPKKFIKGYPSYWGASLSDLKRK